MKRLFIIIFLTSFCSTFSQWEATNWRSDPIIRDIWSSDKIILLQNVYDNITVSYDKGETWQISNSGLPIGLGIKSLVIKDSILILGTQGFLFVSEDLGKIWKESSTGLPKQFVVESMVLFNETVYAGTWGHGVYRSDDNGKTWKPANNGISDKSIYALEVLNNNIYASAGDSLFISADMGESWHYSDDGFSEYCFYGKFIVSGNNIFSASSDALYPGDRNEFFMSNDDGKTWIKKNCSVFEKAYPYSLAVNKGRIFVGTGDSLFYSDDMCESWVKISLLKDEYKGAGSLSVSDGIIYAASGYQIYRSYDNGENWIPLRDSISYGSIYNLIHYNDEIFICLTPAEKNWQTYIDGLFVTTDNGNTFVRKGLENKWVLSVLSIDGSLLAGTNHGIYKSDDKGDTWRLSLPDIFAFSFVTEENYILIPRGRGYLKSTDFGETWKQSDNIFPLKQNNNVMVVRNSLIIAGLDSSIYMTFDNGNTWENRSNGLPELALGIYHIINIGNKLFIGTRYGVFFSSDLGENWVVRNNGLPIGNSDYLYINAFVSTGNYLFVGLENGIYYSSDDGENWKYTNCDNFGNLVITSLIIKDDYIFASTAGPVPGSEGSGIYRAKLSDFGITDVKERDDTQNQQQTIYPLPSSDFINISGIGYDEKVEIFDFLGNRVMVTKYNGKINISSLPIGVYFIHTGSQRTKFIKSP